MVSKSLEMGKAAEYLVCADLLLQGISAYPSDQGLPYDVVADVGGVLRKIQVRSTFNQKPAGRCLFGTRRGCRGNDKALLGSVDYYAFVALDIRQVAYIASDELADISGTGIKQNVTFWVDKVTRNGRMLGDFAAFPSQ